LPCVATDLQGKLEARKPVAGETMTDNGTPTPGASTSSEQPKFETPKTGSARSSIWKWVSWPLKIVFLVIRRLFLIFIYILALLTVVGLTVLGSLLIYAVIMVFLGIFDLIFRVDLADGLNNFIIGMYQYWLDRIQPLAVDFLSRVLDWSDRTGLSFKVSQLRDQFLQFGQKFLDELSIFGTELTRSVILLIFFVIGGASIYHLRIVRRVTYAVAELLVAAVAMWVAIDGMSGGNFALPYVLSLFSGFYVMVRGLQNLDEGLKQKRDIETSMGASGRAHAWVELWEALFYNAYQTDTFGPRAGRIINSVEKISSRKLFSLNESNQTTSVPSLETQDRHENSV
jgi:hypothetical protein